MSILITYSCNSCDSRHITLDEVITIVELEVRGAGKFAGAHFCSANCLAEWAVKKKITMTPKERKLLTPAQIIEKHLGGGEDQWKI